MSVELRAGDGWLRLVGPGVVGEPRRLDATAVEQLRGFAQIYRALLGRGEVQAQLLALGRQLYGWLDGEEHWLQRVRSARPLVLELRAPEEPDASEWAVLHAPWELLADEQGFLAQDAGLSFCPVRRLGDPTAAPPLPDWRLGLVFMAGAPRGEVELDYENEETAILEATGDRGIDLAVEDSGNLDLLAARLSELEAMPVLHLSCHGHNAFRPSDTAAPRPVLMLEDDEGNALPIEAGALRQALGAHEPRLLALSACLSTAAGGNGASPGEVADSFATALVRAGLPAVLGWEGSVSDKEATAFARELYGQLGNRQALAQGASVARQRLLSDAERPSRDWHLARLWLGSEGGAAIVAGRRKRSLVAPDRGFKEFLDKKGQRSPVASREAFVGRRREIQTGLKALRTQDYAGLLIHGMGRSGKSSLAARIAGRLGDGYALAVVYGDYDALSVFQALYEAVDRDRAARELLDRERERILRDPGALQGVLLDLLTGPCAQRTQDGRPVLLVIDDLEQILDEPSSGDKHTVKAAALPVLRAVLRAFDPQETDSRLLLTSRYTFALPDGGKDLAAKLYGLQLPPMGEGAQRKLTLRMEQRARAPALGAGLSEDEVAARRSLLERAQAVARGNPGLQDLLAGLVLEPRAQAGQVEQTLAQMQAYLERGDRPQEATVQAFLEDLALDRLVGLASAGARELLRRATLFEVPVPIEVLAQLGDDGTAAVEQLQGLGLLDRFEDLVEPGRAAAAVNALARPRAGRLMDGERVEYAKRVLPALFQAWGGAADRQERTYALELTGRFPPAPFQAWGGVVERRGQRPYQADLELTRLGLLADNTEVLEACAADGVTGLGRAFAYREAAALGRQVIEALDRAGRRPPADLLRLTGEAARGAYVDTFRLRGYAAADPSDLERAAANAEEACTLARRANDTAAVDRALLTLGTVRRTASDWSGAEQALAEAAKACAPDVAFEANLQLARVYMYRDQPDFGAARRALAAAQARLGGQWTEEQRFDAVSFTAELEIYAGSLEAAVALLTTLLDTAHTASEPGSAVYVHLNQADGLVKMAEREDVGALEDCRKAADAAARAYDAARAEAIEIGWPGLAEQIDQLRSGLALRRQIIDMKERGLAHQGVLFSPIDSSHVLVSEQFVPPVARIGSDGLLTSVGRQAVQTPDTANEAYRLGKLAELAGDFARARVLFHKGVALLECERGSVFDPQRTGSVLENRIEIYRDAMLHDLHVGDVAAAFEMLERARARGLAELIALQFPPELAHFLSALTLAEANVSLRQTQLVQAILDGKSATDVKAVARTFAECRGARERLLAENATIVAGLHGSTWRPPSLGELQAFACRRNVTVLQYLTTDSNTVGWAVGPNKSAARAIWLPRDQLKAKIEAVRSSVIGNPEGQTPAGPFPEDVARHLYLYLIAPLSPCIEGDQLVIVPEGALGDLPFEALVNPETGRPLVAEYAVSYAPNATFLVEDPSNGGAEISSILIVSDEQLDATTKQIVALVASNLEVKVVDNVTPEAVSAQIASANIVHFATHKTPCPDEPLLSSVYIPLAEPQKGWQLGATHMLALPFHKVRLVVIPPSDTAAVKPTIVNDIFGIPWALMVAGARDLVVARWRLGNQQTGAWMKAFYGEFMARRNLAAAARSASLALAGEPATAHPYYWAAFQPFVR